MVRFARPFSSIDFGVIFSERLLRKLLSQTAILRFIGIAICSAIAILEESLQYLSPYRSFTISDMIFSLLGILTAAIHLNYLRIKKAT